MLVRLKTLSFPYLAASWRQQHAHVHRHEYKNRISIDPQRNANQQVTPVIEKCHFERNKT